MGALTIKFNYQVQYKPLTTMSACHWCSWRIMAGTFYPEQCWLLWCSIWVSLVKRKNTLKFALLSTQIPKPPLNRHFDATGHVGKRKLMLASVFNDGPKQKKMKQCSVKIEQSEVNITLKLETDGKELTVWFRISQNELFFLFLIRMIRISLL